MKSVHKHVCDSIQEAVYWKMVDAVQERVFARTTVHVGAGVRPVSGPFEPSIQTVVKNSVANRIRREMRHP